MTRHGRVCGAAGAFPILTPRADSCTLKEQLGRSTTAGDGLPTHVGRQVTMLEGITPESSIIVPSPSARAPNWSCPRPRFTACILDDNMPTSGRTVTGRSPTFVPASIESTHC